MRLLLLYRLEIVLIPQPLIILNKDPDSVKVCVGLSLVSPGCPSPGNNLQTRRGTHPPPVVGPGAAAAPRQGVPVVPVELSAAGAAPGEPVELSVGEDTPGEAVELSAAEAVPVPAGQKGRDNWALYVPLPHNENNGVGLGSVLDDPVGPPGFQGPPILGAPIPPVEGVHWGWAQTAIGPVGV